MAVRGMLTLWSPSTSALCQWLGWVPGAVLLEGQVWEQLCPRGAGQGQLKLPLVILPAATRPECQGKLRHEGLRSSLPTLLPHGVLSWAPSCAVLWAGCHQGCPTSLSVPRALGLSPRAGGQSVARIPSAELFWGAVAVLTPVLTFLHPQPCRDPPKQRVGTGMGAPMQAVGTSQFPAWGGS